MELLPGVMEMCRPVRPLVLRKTIPSTAACSCAFMKTPSPGRILIRLICGTTAQNTAATRQRVEHRLYLRFNQRNTLLLVIPGNYKNRFPACQTIRSELEIQRDLTNRKAPSLVVSGVAPSNSSMRTLPLPIVHRTVELAINRQVRPPIRILRSEGFINVHAETGRVPRVHHSVRKAVGVGKDAVRLLGVAHIFLDAKIVDAQIEMERGRYAHGAQIGRAVRSCPDQVELRQAGDLPQMRDSSGMHHGRPDVIDQLFLDEPLAIINGIEDFTHRQRRGGVLADQTETFLQLRRNRVFEPEQMIRFEVLSEACRFDGREPVMRIMQQVQIRSEFFAQTFK